MNVMFIILVFFISQNLVCSEKKNWQSEMPRTRLKDIYGLKEAKEEFYFLRDCILDPKKLKIGGIKKFQKGCLVEGRPGNEKTEIVRAFAGEMSFPFFYVKASTFGDIYQNSGAKNIASFFEAVFSVCLKKIEIKEEVRVMKEVEVPHWGFWKKKIMQMVTEEKIREEKKIITPVIVFIDELDMLGSRGNRKNNNIDNDKEIGAVVDAIDKINEEDLPIYFFGGTNVPSGIDRALLRQGRFGSCRIVISDPDENTIRELIKNNDFFVNVPLISIIDNTIKYKNFELNKFIDLIRQFNVQKNSMKKREILLELLTKLLSENQENSNLSLCSADIISLLDGVAIRAYKENVDIKLEYLFLELDKKY